MFLTVLLSLWHTLNKCNNFFWRTSLYLGISLFNLSIPGLSTCISSFFVPGSVLFGPLLILLLPLIFLKFLLRGPLYLDSKISKIFFQSLRWIALLYTFDTQKTTEHILIFYFNSFNKKKENKTYCNIRFYYMMCKNYNVNKCWGPKFFRLLQSNVTNEYLQYFYIFSWPDEDWDGKTKHVATLFFLTKVILTEGPSFGLQDETISYLFWYQYRAFFIIYNLTNYCAVIIIIIIIIIINLSWSWATCWPVPVSCIQKFL